ncbi:MAG TPA: NAD(P)H-dependent oxidoreductase [Devosiaceae bacterium]|jgi:NAD(P)H-dependent FMN reductase|nr:NAD(P)H-dependent oxidoreductase [Devosiaceae bacterium]
MYKLMIITASVREGRKGPALATWIEGVARKDPDWEVDPVDLKAVNLPLLDEPRHPRLRQYEYEHTKRWSAMVDRADAFIAVMPEYNFSAAPSMLNALDYVFHEWAYKPMGFVTYGGVSAGTRALVSVRQTVSALKMVPIVEAVNVPFFTQFIDEDGRFNANEQTVAGARAMLAELKKWTGPLKAMRPAAV